MADLKPFLPRALVRAPRDLRLAPQARHGLRALSEVGAARLPARRLARGRRPPGLRPRPHPQAVPRRLRHRVRHPGAARRHRPERAQPGVLGARSPRPPTTGSASISRKPEPRLQVRHRRADRGRGGLGRRDRALRRRSGLRPGVHADAHARAARQPPLLADLRRGRAARAARRHARVRLRRASLHRHRLALLLRRGRRGAFDLVPDGRVRASSSKACSSASRASRW